MCLNNAGTYPLYKVGLPAGTVDSDQPGSRYYRRPGGLALLI
ncbi:hypothetical protein V3C99_013320 [Haemonchus contortus]